MRSKMLSAAAAAMAALGLAACSADGAQAPDSGPEGDPLPFVQFVTDTPGAGDGALLEGMVVDRDGCLGVEGSFEVFVPVFPGEMVEWAEQLRPGSEVALGGGAATWESVQGLTGVEIPEECVGAADYWLVVAD